MTRRRSAGWSAASGAKSRAPAPTGRPSRASAPIAGWRSSTSSTPPFFFGREALTEWLVVALRASPSGQENRFLAILGASGSGKSSLARAGLVAALKRGALDGSGAWPIVILKPGRNPIESLAVALAGLPGGAALIKDTRDLLNIKAFGDDQKSLHLFARLALREAPPSRRLVVLVDQSEEVFTLCEDEAARKALFDNLLYAATVADGQAIVVLTMRADFYGKCGSYPALAAAMSDHQLLVGPMTEDELRRAIERPALLAGGEFEPGLVEMLLQDVEGQPGSLPLLQFTLMELWQRREGRRLTVAAYRAIGGLKGRWSIGPTSPRSVRCRPARPLPPDLPPPDAARRGDRGHQAPGLVRRTGPGRCRPRGRGGRGPPPGRRPPDHDRGRPEDSGRRPRSRWPMRR